MMWFQRPDNRSSAVIDGKSIYPFMASAIICRAVMHGSIPSRLVLCNADLLCPHCSLWVIITAYLRISECLPPKNLGRLWLAYT